MSMRSRIASRFHEIATESWGDWLTRVVLFLLFGGGIAALLRIWNAERAWSALQTTLTAIALITIVRLVGAAARRHNKADPSAE